MIVTKGQISFPFCSPEFKLLFLCCIFSSFLTLHVRNATDNKAVYISQQNPAFPNKQMQYTTNSVVDS